MATKKTIPFILPIHKACGTDSLRPQFTYIHFFDGFAYATDAHIAVKIALASFKTFYTTIEQLNLLNGFSIDSGTYAFLMSCSMLTINEGGSINFQKGRTKGVITLDKYSEVGKMRGEEMVHESLNKIMNESINDWYSNTDKEKFVVGLNPKFLNNISEVLFKDEICAGVRIRAYKPNKPILIDNPDMHKSDEKEQARIGIIMPVFMSSLNS